jgi:hypothetical protein
METRGWGIPWRRMVVGTRCGHPAVARREPPNRERAAQRRPYLSLPHNEISGLAWCGNRVDPLCGDCGGRVPHARARARDDVRGPRLCRPAPAVAGPGAGGGNPAAKGHGPEPCARPQARAGARARRRRERGFLDRGMAGAQCPHFPVRIFGLAVGCVALASGVGICAARSGCSDRGAGESGGIRCGRYAAGSGWGFGRTQKHEPFTWSRSRRTSNTRPEPQPSEGGGFRSLPVALARSCGMDLERATRCAHSTLASETATGKKSSWGTGLRR